MIDNHSNPDFVPKSCPSESSDNILESSGDLGKPGFYKRESIPPFHPLSQIL
jgi:hypothetical protein